MNKLALSIIVSLFVFVQLSVAQSTEDLPRDNFYDRVSPLEREIIPYDGIREADVFWQKRIWRVIDAREKMNLPFRYEGIDWKDMSPLIVVMVDAIKNGEITVYDEDNFKTSLSAEQVDAKFNSVDTIPQYDLDGNYIKDTVIVNPFNPGLVWKYRVKEDWFFDEETSTMQCRIMALAPVLFDEGAGIDVIPFWIYYPKFREVLVKRDAFNFQNDAVRMSWDDIFEMRLFSSYIYKESNVFDRRIQDYSIGSDALRESDRVKMDIFNFEHDLWSF